MKITLTQSQIVDLFVEKMKGGVNTLFRSGTYNEQDPTHYEEIEAEVLLLYGYTFERDFPVPENVRVKIHDCTWGVNFIIETTMGAQTGYWDRSFSLEGFKEKGQWFNVSEKFEKVFLDALLQGENSEESKVTYYDPMGEEIHHG